MKNGKKAAFPLFLRGQYEERGLTKREEFAKAALTGLLANPKYESHPADITAFAAIEYADAILKELGNAGEDDGDVNFD